MVVIYSSFIVNLESFISFSSDVFNLSFKSGKTSFSQSFYHVEVELIIIWDVLLISLSRGAC